MDGELEQLGERIAEHAAHFDAAMHRLLADLREFDQRGGWHVQGARSCAHWLAWRVGWDLVTARERVRVAGKLGELPSIDNALRTGEISYSKVRAMVRVATSANEELLLGHAQLMTGSQLEKLCRKYALVQRHYRESSPRDDLERRWVRRRDTEDGMVKIEATLHPEEAEIVWTMLNHAAIKLAEEDTRQSTTHAPATPHAVHVVGEGDDSAESERPAQVPGAAPVMPVMAVSVPLEPADVGGTSEAATLPEGGRTQEVVGGVAARDAARCAGVDSAESGAMFEINELRETVRESYIGGVRTADAGRCASVGSAESGATFEINELCEAMRDDGARDVVAGGVAESSVNAASMQVRSASVLYRREDAARRAFNRADALVSLAQRYLRGDRPNRTPIEIALTISSRDLYARTADPLEVGEIGESFVARDTARRLSCDAGIVELVEDDGGAPLSVGRKRRAIDGSLKRALQRRDQGGSFPGCTHRLFLEGHHIKHWADGGETSLSNAAQVCNLCRARHKLH